jgi:uncharacterized membrane protein YqiK
VTPLRNRPLTEPLRLVVVVVVVVVVVLTALWWFGAMRPVVRLTADELVVRSPLWTSASREWMSWSRDLAMSGL